MGRKEDRVGSAIPVRVGPRNCLTQRKVTRNEDPVVFVLRGIDDQGINLREVVNVVEGVGQPDWAAFRRQEIWITCRGGCEAVRRINVDCDLVVPSPGVELQFVPVRDLASHHVEREMILPDTLKPDVEGHKLERVGIVEGQPYLIEIAIGATQIHDDALHTGQIEFAAHGEAVCAVTAGEADGPHARQLHFRYDRVPGM